MDIDDYGTKEKHLAELKDRVDLAEKEFNKAIEEYKNK